MVYSIVFLFGLIIGSFLNALIYRLSVGQSVAAGRSYCPECKHVLAPRDLLPLISFMVLRARCRYCRKPISWQYPAVELATALAFLLTYMRFMSGAVDTLILGTDIFRIILFWVYSAFLVVIFVYDLKHYLILDVVIIPASIVAFIGGALLGYPIAQMLLAGFVAAGFFALQFFVSRGRWIGGGDIRLGFLMGLMLSWPLVVIALLLAYILGSIVGIGLIVFGKKQFGSQVPFGTFLTIATFIVLLYGVCIRRMSIFLERAKVTL
jgi:prepilin signal peptidase PulO-like enzyme (type II secretory pathway)